MSGATSRKPAPASASIWWRQEYQDSGKPWHNSTIGPLPRSAMLRRMPLLSITRWVGSLMICSSLRSARKCLRIEDVQGERQAARAAILARTASAGYPSRPASCRLRQQSAFAFAHELRERLRFRPAKFFDRVGHSKTWPVRIETCAAERLPERGQMFERVLIVAARQRVAAPFIVGDLFVAHVLSQHAGEGRDDFLQRNDRADDGIRGSCRQCGAGQQPDGHARDILGRDQRKQGLFLAPGQPDRALRRQALADQRAEIFVKHGGADREGSESGPSEYLFGEIVL